jgi:hypothetical protein
MRFLFLGDVVGRAGRKALLETLPGLRDRFALDFVVVNGENAAGGFGITEAILQDFLDAGADVVTLGNHAFDQRETLVYINRHGRLIRPLNFPAGTPGRGAGVFKARNGADVLVINALGRVFMADIDCPFRSIDNELAACRMGRDVDAVFVDFHAEATSEKQALGLFLDGRVSCVAGTHTHSPTSDHRIMPAGSAYVSDVGMCGDYNSVLGMKADEPINRFITRIPNNRFEPATGAATVAGLAVEIDDGTGLARDVAPLRIGGALSPAMPPFWPAA